MVFQIVSTIACYIVATIADMARHSTPLVCIANSFLALYSAFAAFVLQEGKDEEHKTTVCSKNKAIPEVHAVFVKAFLPLK